MKVTTNIKIALISLATLFGGSLIAATASAETIYNTNPILEKKVNSRKEARKITKVFLKNHKNSKYRRLETGSIQKNGKNWNVTIASTYGLKVATVVVNSETGMARFKKK